MPARPLVAVHTLSFAAVDARTETTARPALALTGLALLGTGAAFLFGAIGSLHVAAASVLCLGGLAALVAARGIPQIRHISPTLLAGTGLLLLVGIIMHGALTNAPFDARRIALALLGVAMQVVAPFLDRKLPLPNREVRMTSIVASGLALLGTPLALWAALSAF